jgi:hypothetical protein
MLLWLFDMLSSLAPSGAFHNDYHSTPQAGSRHNTMESSKPVISGSSRRNYNNISVFSEGASLIKSGIVLFV